jgi:hypothetical protein
LIVELTPWDPDEEFMSGLLRARHAVGAADEWEEVCVDEDMDEDMDKGGESTAAGADFRQAPANFTEEQTHQHLLAWTQAKGWLSGVGFCTLLVD